jgi:hypothetical protein
MSEYHLLPLAALEQPPFCTVILFLCVGLGDGPQGSGRVDERYLFGMA